MQWRLCRAAAQGAPAALTQADEETTATHKAREGGSPNALLMQSPPSVQFVARPRAHRPPRAS